ncbi:hypothetical protein PIB30_064501 [Stylosanthes scabra]|uniref:Putative plant transposon protein domain-containing protein n=1 Tax=Stylosanthes scabra TaxID=79078 RepID=A0ABU6WPI9_9FABA|nr:hypothetical protein [Stylosanthes scabra]
MASSSSVSVIDNYRFKTAFNEELYNTIVKNKKVIAECCVDLDDDEYPEVREQIALRGWRRSFVRGVPIDFSPENIRTVMRFRAQVQGATTDFETRKEHDQQLDRLLADLCMPGATWKLSTGQQRVLIQLRRQELNPIARGWHEISIHSLIPSSNRSEIHIIRAILIHCIMKGEDVRTEDIIADKMVRMAQGIKEKGSWDFLAQFTSCARRLQEEWNRQGYLNHSNTGSKTVKMRINQCLKQKKEMKKEMKKDRDMSIITTTNPNLTTSQKYMAELREIKGKQQELYENNDRFYNQVREEQREMAKEIQQVKNYQVNQTMVDSARNKAIMDELATVRSRQEEFFSNQTNQYNMIRQEQKLLGKEILDVKKYQMSTVTMGSSSSPTPQRYEPDQAFVKIREQHANFSEMQRQLKDWTRNASARECCTVWAHQQANSNLVEMSSHKITKQIYDNIDKRRPMFYGLLKSDLPPSDSAPPPSSSNDPQNPPK